MDNFDGNMNCTASPPLANSDELEMSIVDIIGKVTGMHSDHAEDQKKLARMTGKSRKNTPTSLLPQTTQGHDK